ncbi:PREDICTED: cell division cycle protein 20 homolog [Dufourea novaeangliae]|uniref:Cell division cycle protein 20 like protein n=1 Tax=Dufourea novaeangliae TaxID=178035 RepID=A0A154PHN4_DUFNO|nr:PREDICTED: cell division cycle protein 20 homolog [Dufourea novaeangliae]XP_015432935.1 PREDICTED: cell division cycle protein 20 homolog [Dufourea novaeangliae]KZC11004.1 Cell division cycle protein 20 like protein [Dufourea novaeangliae]
MSHLKYMKEINNLTRMDENIKGPLPRWQKKCLETSNSSVNISVNSARKITNGSFVNTTTGKTPTKKNDTRTKKTPSKGSKKSPSRTSSTPAKTPSGGDRFIPSRSTTNFDLGHYKLQQQANVEKDEEGKVDNVSPSKREMQRLIGENFHGGDINNMRVLSYQNKAPAPPEGYQNPLRVVYSQSKTPASVKASTRYIPQTPDRILDAPEIVDDYYLNLIDWSESNILAVALGSNVYLWNAATGTIEQLFELEGNDYICSVAWIQEGPYLAVGTTVGNTELWDCSQTKRVRVMNGHAARVGSLSWNSHILTSGCRAGQIAHHDVRQRDHLLSSINAHAQEVCGLKWSPDGKYLASGGNDNMLLIWPSIGGQNYSQTQPIYSLNQHQAAVKALAWCPWQNNILASGGGTADRTIRFWNCNTGACLNTVDTKSQVCSLLWSTTYKEIVSGHGYAQNQLTIWKYPGMTKVAELTGHTSRVLHLAMSPDGTTILSAGADETLRLWKCFQPDPHKKKETSEIKSVTSRLKQSIR